jgi:hypothetical protein
VKRLFECASLLVIATVAGGSVGCGSSSACGVGSNQLAGSISDIFPDISQVDRVCARLQTTGGTALRLQWFNGNNIVAEVIGMQNTTVFMRGERIPLVTGSVSRVTSPMSDYPSMIVSGFLEVDSDVTVGSDFSGCFSVTFDSTGTMDMTQRTLNGAIDSTLQAENYVCN